MGIRENLESRILKSSNVKLLLFPNKKVKELYELFIGFDPEDIILTTDGLENKLVGLRYGSYKFIGYDELKRCIDEKRSKKSV